MLDTRTYQCALRRAFDSLHASTDEPRSATRNLPYGKVGCFCRLYVFFFPSFTLVAHAATHNAQPIGVHFVAEGGMSRDGYRAVRCRAAAELSLRWVGTMDGGARVPFKCLRALLGSLVRSDASRLCVSRISPFVAKRCALHLLNDRPDTDLWWGPNARWPPSFRSAALAPVAEPGVMEICVLSPGPVGIHPFSRRGAG